MFGLLHVVLFGNSALNVYVDVNEVGRLPTRSGSNRAQRRATLKQTTTAQSTANNVGSDPNTLKGD